MSIVKQSGDSRSTNQVRCFWQNLEVPSDNYKVSLPPLINCFT